MPEGLPPQIQAQLDALPVPPDLADRAMNFARRRRRRQAAAAGAAALLIAAGAAVPLAASSTGARNDQNQIIPAGPAPAAPTPTAPSSTAATRRPATLIIVGDPPAGARRLPTPRDNNGPGLLTALYSLPGRANANTIPPGGATAENSAAIHPETNLSFQAQLGVSALPETEVPPALKNIVGLKKVVVRGHEGYLSYPTRTFGMLKLDWIQDNVHFTVRVLRLNTPDGVSGIDEKQLVAVANSTSAG